MYILDWWDSNSERNGWEGVAITSNHTESSERLWNKFRCVRGVLFAGRRRYSSARIRGLLLLFSGSLMGFCSGEGLSVGVGGRVELFVGPWVGCLWVQGLILFTGNAKSYLLNLVIVLLERHWNKCLIQNVTWLSLIAFTYTVTGSNNTHFSYFLPHRCCLQKPSEYTKQCSLQ